MHNALKKLNNARGFTLLEMLVVVGISMLLMGIAVSNMKELTSPLQDGSAQVVSYFKQVRARALSSTSAYTVYPISTTRLGSRFGATCADAAPIDDATLGLRLPTGASITTTGWTVCFSTRGLASTNVTLTLTDTRGRTRTIEILLGGSVRAI